MERRIGGDADGSFPMGASVLLGVGFGGFFDGIVFHQLLQWHHMLSSWRPVDTVDNLELNTLWDGLFHAFTYLCLAAGLYLFWRAARQSHFVWSGRRMASGLLIGWGGFNVVEGFINHQILGIHHVNELAPAAQQPYWDAAFIAWGLAMLIGGWALYLSARRAEEEPHIGPSHA
jgi:uncharacterized membrane protein